MDKNILDSSQVYKKDNIENLNSSSENRKAGKRKWKITRLRYTMSFPFAHESIISVSPMFIIFSFTFTYFTKLFVSGVEIKK